MGGGRSERRDGEGGRREREKGGGRSVTSSSLLESCGFEIFELEPEVKKRQVEGTDGHALGVIKGLKVRKGVRCSRDCSLKPRWCFAASHPDSA